MGRSKQVWARPARRQWRMAAPLACLLSTTPFWISPLAVAGPTGGSVDINDGEISVDGNTTTVIQRRRAPRLAIDWDTFNLDSNERVVFEQRGGSSSVLLNRIDAANGPSSINGRVTANGIIFFSNKAGLIFGQNAVVDVHGFVATTADIADADFQAGNFDFSIPGNPDAKVENFGLIDVGQDGQPDGVDQVGIAALVAPQVVNGTPDGSSGVINARLGKAVLAGAETFTLDFAGDQLITFAPASASGQGVTQFSAVNTGEIHADGGVVRMTARTASDVLDSVISMNGVIVANTVSLDDAGEIILAGTDNTQVQVSGTLQAEGDGSGERGGAITITGDAVELNGATVSVDALKPSADAKPGEIYGTIQIGGGQNGEAPTRRITVDAGSRISADNAVAGDPDAVTSITLAATEIIDIAGTVSAQTQRDLGTVNVQSDGRTTISGSVSATHLGVTASESVSVSGAGKLTVRNGSLTLEAGADDGTIAMDAGAGITATDSAVAIRAAEQATLANVTLEDTGTGTSTLSVEANTIDAAPGSPAGVSLTGAVGVALVANRIGTISPFTLAADAGNAALDLAPTGEGSEAEIAVTSGFLGTVALALANALSDITLTNGSNGTMSVNSADAGREAIVAASGLVDTRFSVALADQNAQLTVPTGTISTNSDVQLNSAGDIVLGTGAGTAIAFTGTSQLLSLDAGGSILSDGGLIDLGADGLALFVARGGGSWCV